MKLKPHIWHTEESGVIVEWIYEHFRIALCLEADCNSWYFVGSWPKFFGYSGLLPQWLLKLLNVIVSL